MCEQLKKRAKRKYLSTPIKEQLAHLNSPLSAKYTASILCASSVIVNDGKMKTRYCKRPWCTICSPIKTAVRINNYKKPLQELGDLLLTTLTIPNVPGEQINTSFQLFRKIFRQFRNTRAKQGLQFRGVYNFETTYNSKTGLFHPHIHIIHECIPIEHKAYHERNRTQGEQFKNELIEYFIKNTKHLNTSYKGQDTRLCTDLIEGFKYAAKSVYTKKINGKNEIYIPIDKLDIIYQQIQGLRCFNSFGIKKVSEEQIEKEMENLESYNIELPNGLYGWNVNDWVNKCDNSIKLSGYIPTKKQQKYFEKISLNQFYNHEKQKE